MTAPHAASVSVPPKASTDGGALVPLQSLPPIVVRLGYMGLLPFIFGALLVWLVYAEAHPHVVDALAKYAAAVLSFLGGLYWMLAYRAGREDPFPYVWGAGLSVMAWIAAIMPAYAGLVVHGVLLIVAYLVDRRWFPRLGASAWLTMRFRLSAIAALSCFIAAQGS